MTYKICMPDYDNSILGIPNSILKGYGLNPLNKTIPELDKIFSKKYKNVVFMIFDAMGSELLAHHLPESSFLRKHKVKDISSVFPCTTTAATKTMYSGLSPKEHGWLAWQCYFKEYDAYVELFRSKDYYTKNKVADIDIAETTMPFEHISEKIVKKGISFHEIFPAFREGGVKTIKGIFSKIEKVCSASERNFILSYWNEPDGTMHNNGCFVNKVTETMEEISSELEKCSKKLSDTVFIITADHGHIDISENIFLDEIPEIDECLELAPSMERRTVSFNIKHDKKDVFIKRFNERFEKDFILYSKKEYVDKFLGPGKSHEKVTDFVGDFVAIAITDKSLMYKTPDTKDINFYKGLHAGLTSQEMIVPLIVVES